MNGAKRMLTTEELVAFAQKGAAADERFQEAAKVRAEAAATKAEAEKAMKIVHDLQALNSAPELDEVGFRNLAKDLGVKDEAIEQMLAELQEESEPVKKKEKVVAKTNNQLPQPVGYKGLDPELQSFFKEVMGKIWDEDVRKSLDTDQVLKYNIEKGGPEARNVLLDSTRDVIRRRVLEDPASASDRTRLINEAIQEVRSTVKKFGILNKPDVPPGFGPAPLTGSHTLYPKTEPKRVDASQAGHADFIADKIAWFLKNGPRKQQAENS